MDGDAPLFLGLDASTQALKASLLDVDLNVLSELEVRFDRDLPHYKTTGGVSAPTADDDEGTVVAPVMLYVESIDLLAERMRSASWPLERIRAVSAAGQQHASVYFSRAAPRIFTTLSAGKTLTEQVEAAFSSKVVPNWQDSSTGEACKAFERALGGADEMARVTGSKAHTRFTGPQIYKFRTQQPQAYKDTERIGLVSSFVTTMLCVGEGADASTVIKGIDESDACGMNLLDMRPASAVEASGKLEPGWNQTLLALASGESEGADASLGGAVELEKKLGVIYRDAGAPVGTIGKWWMQRYGFSADCQVFPGTGDNPATFLAFSLAERQAIISLGTSDTVMVATHQYVPDADFHAFFHPARLPSSGDAFFNMLVYKSGSLAREWIRDQYCQRSWDVFNADVERFRLREGEGEKRVGFYWLRPEIIPAGASGVHRYTKQTGGWAKADEFGQAGMNAGTILETQFLNYRYRSSSIVAGPSSSSSTVDTTTLPLAAIYAVGGASSNPTITQSMADVFGCDIVKPVQPSEDAKSWTPANYNFCSVGAAYKAAWGWSRMQLQRGDKVPEFDEFVHATKSRQAKQAGLGAAGGAAGESVEGGVQVICRPREGRTQVYTDVIGEWKQLEERAQKEA
ncbi:probable XKS1-xylulokinase [Sporisorium reilianum SRZ2]|uniref:Xylulose kinase n=1 Tax=Sporisorium reilianum (strain SRZ2) TaxID=999809 RepID=E6ZY48_SPORE|nr:probable XKS1-xylulokinase [Sporisorium reilianum SRZ2]